MSEMDLDARLEKIRANPTDLDLRLMLSDWLQSVDHPWGKLIAVQHALASEKDKTRRKQLREEEADLLERDPCGLLDVIDDEEHFVWRAGFVEHATLTGSTGAEIAEALGPLLDAVGAAALTRLVLDARPDSLRIDEDNEHMEDDIIEPWGDVIELLDKRPLPRSVAHLSIGASPPEPITAYVRMPDFAALSRVIPHVNTLEIAGAAPVKAGVFELPELVSLEVRLACIQDDVLPAIARSSLPNVERLSIWLGGLADCTIDELFEHDEAGYEDEVEPSDEDEEEDEYDPEIERGSCEADDLAELSVGHIMIGPYRDHVSRFLLGAMPPKLRELGLQSSVLNATVCQALVDAPIVRRIEKLDLSLGELRPDGAAVLLENKTKLAHLKSIDLRRTGMSASDAAALRGAFPNALFEEKPIQLPEFFFRYVTSME